MRTEMSPPPPAPHLLLPVASLSSLFRGWLEIQNLFTTSSRLLALEVHAIKLSCTPGYLEFLPL